MIQEKIFEIKHNKELAKMLMLLSGSVKDAKYGYVVYANTKEKSFIDGEWSDDLEKLERWQGFSKDLEEFVTKLSPQEIMDFMFFIDIRNVCKCFDLDIHSFYEQHFKRNDIVDNILQDSYGYLLWTYQFENLLRLFYIDSCEILKIRKGLILKKKQYWDMTKKMLITNNCSLYDVLAERAVLKDMGCVRLPRFKSAFNLIRNQRR